MLRRRLDKEMGAFRRAGRDLSPTDGLLRAVRQALEIPVGEIAAKVGVVKSVVFAYERGELNATIQLGTMARMAGAMGCKLVYGLVPTNEKTLESLAEERIWKQMMEARDRECRERESRDRGDEGTMEPGGISPG